MKFAKFLRTPPAALFEFCSGGCVIVVSVINIRCISNECIKVNLLSKVRCCIHSQIMSELVTLTSPVDDGCGIVKAVGKNIKN